MEHFGLTARGIADRAREALRPEADRLAPAALRPRVDLASTGTALQIARASLSGPLTIFATLPRASPGTAAAGGPAQDCGGRRRNTLRMALLRTRARRRDGAVRDRRPAAARRGDAPRTAPGRRRRSSSLRDATVVYPGGHVGLERVSLRARARRVRVRRRAHRLRQVDPDQDADPRGRAGQRRGADRRAATSTACRPAAFPICAGASAPCSRTSSCSPTARVYDNVAYALQVTGGGRARDPAQGPRDPAPGRPAGQGPQLPGPALGRRAAARLDRASLRQPPAAAARRRADREPRSRDLDRDHAAPVPDQPHRHDRVRRHPRPRDGRQDAPPGDGAGRGTAGPRRGHRRLRRRVDERVRAPRARRDGRRRGPHERRACRAA